jgi:hypothetical protein
MATKQTDTVAMTEEQLDGVAMTEQQLDTVAGGAADVKFDGVQGGVLRMDKDRRSGLVNGLISVVIIAAVSRR